MSARDNLENDISPGTGSAEKPMLYGIAPETAFSPETEVYVARCFGFRAAKGDSAKGMRDGLLSVLWLAFSEPERKSL